MGCSSPPSASSPTGTPTTTPTPPRRPPSSSPFLTTCFTPFPSTPAPRPTPPPPRSLPPSPRPWRHQNGRSPVIVAVVRSLPLPLHSWDSRGGAAGSIVEASVLSATQEPRTPSFPCDAMTNSQAYPVWYLLSRIWKRKQKQHEEAGKDLGKGKGRCRGAASLSKKC